MIEAVQNYKRTAARWKHLMRKALFLEDVAQAELTGQLAARGGETKSQLEYYWQVMLKRPAIKVSARFLFIFI